MLRVDELMYLYRLKKSKEHEYYELVPWEQRTRIVKSLPSSFRYWKSRFFFMSGDDFETPSGEVWGELSRLHCRWGTPTLGVSLFLSLYLGFVAFAILATDSSISCFAQLRDDPNLRLDIRSVYRRQSSMRKILRVGTILWTHVLSPFIASGRSLLPSSCATSKLKEKSVSVEFISTCFLIYIFPFLQVFSSCRNDDQIQ